jgi:hypothetical protein
MHPGQDSFSGIPKAGSAIAGKDKIITEGSQLSAKG